MLRRMLLGSIGALVVCGTTVAAPPGLQPNPHSEGRELDPVTREYYLPSQPAGANEDAPERGPITLDDRGSLWALLLNVHEAIINEFTMPLGTVTMPTTEHSTHN